MELNLIKMGVCSACNFAKIKDDINWSEREDRLLELLEKF